MTDQKPLKILVMSHSSELGAGGGEMSMMDLLDYWANQGLVEPYFVIRRPLKEMAKALRQRGWKYYAMYYGNWAQRNPSKRAEDIFRNATYNTKTVFAIENIIQEIKPDMVLTNTIVAPWAAVAAYFQQVPHVWFVREYGDLDHRHVFELGRDKIFQDINSLSVKVVTNSKTLAKHLTDYMPADKITTLYTPFNIDELEQKSQQSSINPFKLKDSLKLVITGKIAVSKGQQEVAEAVGRLNQMGYPTELCVIGAPVNPSDAEPLHNVIKQYHLADKVHLVGRQPNQAVLSILKKSDVGIMTSRQEAFGRVTFEYLAIGRPVVGANSGATPEMIKPGHNGYLYKPGDVNDLRDQLLNYCQNRELVSQHGQAAKQSAVKMMASPYNADNLIATLQAIVQSKPKLPVPLNFSHRWLEYPTVAQQYIKDTDAVALWRLAYLRSRHQAKLTVLWLLGLFDKDKKITKIK